MDDNIQDLNIELLEEICIKKNDYKFVFDNLPLLIKSLKALNQLLKQLETAEDCIYNLPQIEEILSSLIINKIVLLNPEAVTCIIHCIFEFSKFFKDKSESDFISSNVKLSDTQLWCIQRIRTLMISTEFPRSNYIKRLEESLKKLDYSATDFYEEIVNEQLEVLQSYVEFTKNENLSIDNINEILDLCIYMLDQPSLVLPLIEEIIIASNGNLKESFIINVIIGPKNIYQLLSKKIKKKLIMEYTIVHEQEIINICQSYLNIYNNKSNDINDHDILASHLNDYLQNSLIVEVLLDAINSKNKSFIQECIIIFCNIIHNLNYIKISQLFLHFLSIMKSNIDYNFYRLLLEEIFPSNLDSLFEILNQNDFVNRQSWLKYDNNPNNLFFIKVLIDCIKKNLSLKPIFSIDYMQIDENQKKLDNINYQNMYHQFSMNDWLWFWFNFLFEEIKIYVQKSVCQYFIQEKENSNENNNEALYIYIDYLQMGMILENNYYSETTNNVFTDYIMEFKESLKDLKISQVSIKSIILIHQKLIENQFLYSILASELYAQFLKEIILIKPSIHSTSLFIEMEKAINHSDTKEALQNSLHTLWYILIQSNHL